MKQTATTPNERKERGAPILWFALILLALCIIGTLVVVVVSAIKGADELPATVYHVEGAAADRDLAALTQADALGLNASVALDGQRVTVALRDRQGALAEVPALTLRLTHATRAAADVTVPLAREESLLVGTMAAPLARGSWWAELRPASAQWLLRGRLEPRGGRIVSELD